MAPHESNWCLDNAVVFCNADNTLSRAPCQSGQSCWFSQVTDTASCMDQEVCGKCEGVFGIYSYMGYNVPTEKPIAGSTTNKFQIFCPSNFRPAPNPDNTGKSANAYIFGCYLDYSRTTIDGIYACEDVKTCYDYTSESSCEQDYCGKFTITGDNGCEWNEYVSGSATKNSLGKGVCAPKNIDAQDCMRCTDEDYNRLGSACTADICHLYGKNSDGTTSCYFDSYSNECWNKDDVTCDMYMDEKSCNGATTGTPGQNVFTNVRWLNDDNNENTGNYRTGSFNSETPANTRNPSIDGAGIGVCKWVAVNPGSPDSFSCIRDADNSYYSLESDCRISDMQLNAICNVDTLAPITTIDSSKSVPTGSTPGTLPVYGLNMNLLDQVIISDDNPWPILGDEDVYKSSMADWRSIRTLYCVDESGSCYPTATLKTTSEDGSAYVADLAEFDVDRGDNGKTFKFRYYSEDPARNLELIKTMDFKLDSLEPTIDLTYDIEPKQVSLYQWISDVDFILELDKTTFGGADIDEQSLPVQCTFTLTPLTPAAALTFAFNGNDENNMPSLNNPVGNILYNTGDQVIARYYGLSDGLYEYEYSCVDNVGNIATNTGDLTIDGDIRISDPQPYNEVYRSNEITSNQVEISVRTSNPGTCRYSQTEFLYDRMPSANAMTYDSTTSRHTKKVPIPAANPSGIYKYYVSCELTDVNNQKYIVPGNDADSPFFSVDDLAPQTTLMFKDPQSQPTAYKWTNYAYDANKVYDGIALRLNCSDSNVLLTTATNAEMTFGCEDTMYYCIPYAGVDCYDTDDYTEISPDDDPITLSYGEGNSPDKEKYGNAPSIFYFSKDKGGNIENFRITKLNVRNTHMDNPIVSFVPSSIEFDDPKIKIVNGIEILNNYHGKLEIKYVGEKIVTVDNIKVVNIADNSEVPIEYSFGSITANDVIRVYEIEYIPSGTYRLIINSSDDDGNINGYNKTFGVNHTGNEIRLSNPRLGIGDKNPYQFLFMTKIASTCKYGFVEVNACNYNPDGTYSDTALDCWFRDARYLPITKTTGFGHEIVNNNDPAPTFNDGHVEDFISPKPLNIICKINNYNSNKNDAYIKRSVHYGHLTVPPTIDLKYILDPVINDPAFPNYNVIINENSPKITISIKTDQLSVCRINLDHQVNVIDLINQPFDNESNADDFSQYKLDHTYTIDYTDTGFDEGDARYEFQYNIECTNLAQLKTETTADVVIDIDKTPPVAGLTQISPYFTRKEFRVSCTDHCTDSYEYKVIGIDETCTDSGFSGPIKYENTIDITSESKICVKVKDVLGRYSEIKEEAVQMIDFNVGSMKILVPYEYSKDNGDNVAAYSATNTFELSVWTGPENEPVDASCAYGINTGQYSDLDPENIHEELYNALIAAHREFENTGTQEDQTVHPHTQPNFKLNVDENTPEGWIIICKVFNAAPGDNPYISREVFFYWDSTLPSVNIDAVARIYDWNNRLKTNITIITDDDTMCTITDSTSTPAEELIVDSGQDDVFESYRKTRVYSYNIPSQYSQYLDAVGDITLEAMCSNRAKGSFSKEITIRYELDKQVDAISSLDTIRVFGSRNITINATTDIMSTCSVTIDKTTTVDLNSANRLFHARSLDLSSGKHTLELSCRVPENNNIGKFTKEYTIFIDMSPPTVQLIGPDSYNGPDTTCNIDGFTINVVMSDADSSIESYEYTISGDGITPNYVVKDSGNLNNIFVPPEGSILRNNRTYTINVQAKDLAGNVGGSSIAVRTFNPVTGVTCDHLGPQIAINTAYHTTSSKNFAIANLTCNDQASSGSSVSSGCSQFFKYSFVPATGSGTYEYTFNLNNGVDETYSGTVEADNGNEYDYTTDIRSLTNSAGRIIGYRATIDFSDTWNAEDFLDSETIELFGKSYIFDPSNENDEEVLTLFSSEHTIIVGKDSTETVTYMGEEYTLEVLGGNSDDSTAILRVNGDTTTVEEGDSKTVGGLPIYIKNIFITNIGDDISVQLFFGSDKLEFDTDGTVTKNHVDIDDVTADYVKGTFTGWTEISSIILTGTILLSGDYEEPVFDAFTISSEISSEPSCSGATYEDEASYSDSLIFFEDKGTLCIQAKDLSGNPTNAEKFIDINPITCGNGVIEKRLQPGYFGLNTRFDNWNWDSYASLPDEQCDGSNLAGETCISLGLGFVGGTLSCSPTTCGFDTSQCTEGMGVSLVSPQPFGIGSTSSYKTTVNSEYDSQCRYGLLDDGDNNNIVNAYNGALMNDMTRITDGSRNHERNIGPLSIQENYVVRYAVCRMTDTSIAPSEVQQYGILKLYEGFDTSAPQITSITTDKANDKINDFNNREIAILVTTNEDTICKISDSLNTVTDYTMYGSTTQYYSYSRSHTATLDYSDLSSQPAGGLITLSIECFNKAGLNVENTKNIYYDIATTITIEKVSPHNEYITGYLGTFAVKTNILSECYVSNGTVNRLMEGTGLYHEKALGIIKGWNSITVTCSDPSPTKFAYPAVATYRVYGGANMPIGMNIDSNQYTCSLSGINAKLSATKTTLDIAHYSYTVTDLATSAIVCAGNSQDGNMACSASITDGRNYIIEAFAVDTNNQASEHAFAVVMGSDASSNACDLTAPVVSITKIATGYNDFARLDIQCTDSGTPSSGCKPYYYYDIVNLGQSCANAQYTESQTRAYGIFDIFDYNNGLLEGTLCIRGSDNNDNFGYNHYNLSIGSTNYINIVPMSAAVSPKYVPLKVIATLNSVTDLDFRTDVGAVCKYSTAVPSATDSSVLYNSYTAFTSSTGVTHKIEDFNTQSIEEQFIDVICFAATQPAANQYSRASFIVAFVNETPNVTGALNPNNITDWFDRSTEISSSTNTKTICTVTTNDGQHDNLKLGNEAAGSAAYARSQFAKMYYDVNTYTPSTYYYIIECKDYLGRVDQATITLEYNLPTTLDIEILSPLTYASHDINIIAATDIISNCTLTFNGSSKGLMYTDLSGKNHISRLTNIPDGKYAASVTCIAPIRNMQGTKSYNITINTTVPPAVCGDGIAQKPNSLGRVEDCDGLDLGGKTCTSGFVSSSWIGGQLKCRNDCTFDFTSCDNGKGWCGNGEVDGPNSQNVFEQCDGSVPSGLDCSDFGFKGGGRLSCSNGCMVNTSACLQEGQILSPGFYPTCNNNQLESGEQCEINGNYTNIFCKSFGYDYGSVSCSSNCQFSMNNCAINDTRPSRNNNTNNGNLCGNGRKDNSEECDRSATGDGLFTTSCRIINASYSSGTLGCNAICKIDYGNCTLGPSSGSGLCTNGVKDSSESDIDCGGSCGACALDKTCITNGDCTSEKCTLGKCVVNTCKNTIFDAGFGETDVDCGGTECDGCAVGKKCSTGTDCESGYCVDQLCAEDPCSNGLLDVGEADVDCGGSCVLCSAGSSCTLDEDCSTGLCEEGICAGLDQEPEKNPAKAPLIWAGLISMLGSGGYILYRTYYSHKPTNTSKSGPGLSGFTHGTQPAAPQRPTMTPEQQRALLEKQREALLKKRQQRSDERKSFMEKLGDTLAGKTEAKSETPAPAETKQAKGEDEFVELKDIKATKDKEKADTFSRLKEIGKGHDELFKKTEKSPAEGIDHSDALKMFGKVDRDIVMSRAFKEVLSKLLSQGRISKENVSKILFEYMDKGMITKAEVAKISAELKII
ncbi:MAG TPA: hypothetical protein VEC16_02770 [Alphaproteobacteria bacterium]|nr:hypothetical protein [Alphaproteobacteria bacterium]